MKKKFFYTCHELRSRTELFVFSQFSPVFFSSILCFVIFRDVSIEIV